MISGSYKSDNSSPFNSKSYLFLKSITFYKSGCSTSRSIQFESEKLRALNLSFRQLQSSASLQTSSLALTFPFGTMHKYFTLDSNEEGNESVSQTTTSVKRNEDSDIAELGGGKTKWQNSRVNERRKGE